MRTMLILSALIALASQTVSAQQLTFVTGPLGGSWYPIGSGMIEAIEKETGQVFTQQPGGGVSNAFAVGQGKAQLGISTGHVAASAVQGRDDFEGRPQENLRLIGTMYPQQYILVVWQDSDIENFADLAGKRLQTTRRGSSTELMTQRVLEAHGLSYDDLESASYGNLSDGVNQMRDHQIDAMSHLITNPTSHALELQSVQPIRLVPLTAEAIDTLTGEYAGYMETTVPGGTYEGQTEDVPTVGDGAVLVTSADVDEELVYEITKALFANQEALASAQSVMVDFTPEQAAADPAIEIHPGALRFYREAGALH